MSAAVAARLAELVRRADRWADDSVASGWLVRRAADAGIGIDCRAAYRLLRVHRARRAQRQRRTPCARAA